jgi:hypothetical protein
MYMPTKNSMFAVQILSEIDDARELPKNFHIPNGINIRLMMENFRIKARKKFDFPIGITQIGSNVCVFIRHEPYEFRKLLGKQRKEANATSKQ